MIEAVSGESTAVLAVWKRHGTQWRFSVQSAGDPAIGSGAAAALVISAVDRLGNESRHVTLRLAARAAQP